MCIVLSEKGGTIMGLFDKFVKSRNTYQFVEENPTTTVNLTKNIELNKKISLRKESRKKGQSVT